MKADGVQLFFIEERSGQEVTGRLEAYVDILEQCVTASSETNQFCVPPIVVSGGVRVSPTRTSSCHPQAVPYSFERLDIAHVFAIAFVMSLGSYRTKPKQAAGIALRWLPKLFFFLPHSKLMQCPSAINKKILRIWL